MSGSRRSFFRDLAGVVASAKEAVDPTPAEPTPPDLTVGLGA